MAHTTAQGVQRYVQAKNEMAQVDGAPDAKSVNPKPSKGGLGGIDVSDLKMPVTPRRGKSQSNTHAARNGEHGGRIASLRSHSGNRPVARGGLLSTDASNADRTSASGSTQQAKQGKAPKPPDQVETTADNEAASSEYETDTDDEGNDLPHHPVNQDRPQAHSVQTAHTFSERRISGDSYPATTSGRPSEVDEDEAQSMQTQAHAHARGMHAPDGSMTVRGSGARSGMTAPNTTVPQSGVQLQISQPLHGGDGLLAGFAFGKAPGTQLNVGRTFPGGLQAVPPPPRAQPEAQPPQQSHGQHHHTANQLQKAAQQSHGLHHHTANQLQKAAQQSHGPQHSTVNQQLPQPHAIASRALVNVLPAARQPAPEKQTFMQAPAKSVIPHDSRRLLEDVSNQYLEPGARHFAHSPDPEQRARKSHTTTPNQNAAQSDLLQPSDNDYSEFDYRNGADGQDYEGVDEQQRYFEEQHPDEHPEEQYPEEHRQERKMDYDGTELYNKTYADIKQQCFDLDPHAKTFDLPEDLAADSLQSKLAGVMKLKPQSQQQNPQAEFFRSMTSAEWEDSGDWFLDRFGDLVGKLKNARKEKRKFTRQFEDEIERRHDAVAKKQKFTESALSVMKESGGKILNDTPKKKLMKSKK